MKLSIADSYDPVVVDLWGEDFTLLPITKQLEKKVAERAEEIDRKFEQVKDFDELVGFIADTLDLRLKSQNGGTRKASTVVKGKWKSNELNVAQLVNFWRALGDAETADRPT